MPSTSARSNPSSTAARSSVRAPAARPSRYVAASRRSSVGSRFRNPRRARRSRPPPGRRRADPSSEDRPLPRPHGRTWPSTPRGSVRSSSPAPVDWSGVRFGGDRRGPEVGGRVALHPLHDREGRRACRRRETDARPLQDACVARAVVGRAPRARRPRHARHGTSPASRSHRRTRASPWPRRTPRRASAEATSTSS